MRSEAPENTARKFLGQSFNAATRQFVSTVSNLAGEIALSSVNSECYVSIGDSIESCEKEMKAKLHLGAGAGDVHNIENNRSVTVNNGHTRRSGFTAQIDARRTSQESECHLLMTAIERVECTLQNTTVLPIENRSGHAFTRSVESIVGYSLSIKFHTNSNLDELRRSIEGENPALVKKILSAEKLIQTQNTETSYELKVKGIGGYNPPTRDPKGKEESIANYFERVSAAVDHDFQSKRETSVRIFEISQGGLVPYDVTPDTTQDLKTLLDNYSITLKKLQTAYDLLEGDKLKNKNNVNQHISFDELLKYMEKTQAEKNYLEKFSALPACIKDRSFETYENLKNNADHYLGRLKQIKLIVTKRPIIIQLTDAKGPHYLYQPKEKDFCAITTERRFALSLEIEFSNDNALPYLDDGLNNQSFYLKLSHKNKYLKATRFSRLPANKDAGVTTVDTKDNATLWKLTFISPGNVHDKKRCLENVKEKTEKIAHVLTSHYKEEGGIFYIHVEDPSLPLSSAPLQVEFEAHQLQLSFGAALDNALNSQVRLNARAAEELEARSQRSGSARKTQSIETQSQTNQSSITENTASSMASPVSPSNFDPANADMPITSELTNMPATDITTNNATKNEATSPLSSSSLPSQPSTLAPKKEKPATPPAPTTEAEPATLAWVKILEDLIKYYVGLSDPFKKIFIEQWNILFLSTEMNFLQKFLGMSALINQYHRDHLLRANLLQKGTSHFQEVNKTKGELADTSLKQQTENNSNDNAMNHDETLEWETLECKTQKAIETWVTESIKNLPKSPEKTLEKREATWNENCKKAEKKVDRFQKEKLVHPETKLLWPQASLQTIKAFLQGILLSLPEDQLNTFLTKIQSVILGTEDASSLADDQIALSDLLDVVFEEYKKCPNNMEWAEIIRGLMLNGADPSAWIKKNIISLYDDKNVIDDAEKEIKFQFLYLLLNQIDFAFSHMFRRAEFLGDSTVYLGDRLTDLIIMTDTFSKKLQQCIHGRDYGFRKERAMVLAAVLIYVPLFLNSLKPRSGDTQLAFFKILECKLAYEEAVLASTNPIGRAVRNTGLSAGNKLENAVHAINSGLLTLGIIRECRQQIDDALKEENAFLKRNMVNQDTKIKKAETRAETAETRAETERQEKEKAQAKITTALFSTIKCYHVAPYKDQLIPLQQSMVNLLAGRALDALTNDELTSYTALQNTLAEFQHKIESDYLEKQKEGDDDVTLYDASQIHEAVLAVLKKQADALTVPKPAPASVATPPARQEQSSANNNQAAFFQPPVVVALNMSEAVAPKPKPKQVAFK